MALRDRMVALQLIDRIKQHEMETIGATLTGLRAAEKKLEDEIVQLQNSALREATQSTEETRIFLPAYLKSVEARQRILTQERIAASEKAVLAEEKLLMSFRESKTTEQVLKQVAEEVALEDSRSTAAQMDDAGRALYMLTRNGQIPG